jgi:methylthioribose-1-phosphate isomerase
LPIPPLKLREDVEISRQSGGPAAKSKESQQPKPRGRQYSHHCNAGWLATVDWGTALAPVYMAHEEGIPVHVWVDETRPRNQGASLTAWELGHHGVRHTVIPDNTGGHLMQHGLVDMCIVGTDRTTARGDVCNKIGTYLKALAPLACLPFNGTAVSHHRFTVLTAAIDRTAFGRRVTEMAGLTRDGRIETVSIVAPGSPVANYAST